MQKYEDMRKAIDVMTAWATDDPDSTKFSFERLVEYGKEEPDGDIHLMFGLVSLAGSLLLRLEAETGKTMQCHLQDIAQETLDN